MTAMERASINVWALPVTSSVNLHIGWFNAKFIKQVFVSKIPSTFVKFLKYNRLSLAGKVSN